LKGWFLNGWFLNGWFLNGWFLNGWFLNGRFLQGWREVGATALASGVQMERRKNWAT
jgi:hypothetical protein